MIRRPWWSLVALIVGALVLSGPVTDLAWAAPADQRNPLKPVAAEDGDEPGVFATLCQFSHAAPDDPIVHPNMPGMSHRHEFFGNVTTAAASTYETLRTGATTCRTAADASGYWVPALFQNGAEVRPLSAKVYYRAGQHDGQPIAAFPPGFRIVAGDAAATTPQGRGVTFWNCRDKTQASENPLACPADAPLNLHIRFPECWDGASVDSPDHRSHTAYGRGGTCPASHPVALPTLSLIVHYPITGEPGTIGLDSGSPYSAHADFFNAWDQGFLSAQVDRCLTGSMRCGISR